MRQRCRTSGNGTGGEANEHDGKRHAHSSECQLMPQPSERNADQRDSKPHSERVADDCGATTAGKGTLNQSQRAQPNKREQTAPKPRLRREQRVKKRTEKADDHIALSLRKKQEKEQGEENSEEESHEGETLLSADGRIVETAGA